jgi:signal transduction histidine kinase
MARAATVGWGYAMAGNMVGGVMFGIILAVNARIFFPDVDFGQLMWAFAETAVAPFVVITVVTWFLSHAVIRRLLGWYVEGRSATAEEIRNLALLPRIVAVINAPAWVGMTAAHQLYFVHVKNYSLPAVVMTKTVAAYVLGFAVATPLVTLLLERQFRPYLQRALPADRETWPGSLGLGPRLVIAWCTVAGVPLLFIVYTWIALTPEEMVRAASGLRITALLALGAGLVVFLLLGRTITGPLRRLRAAQARVATGDLDVAVEIDEAGEIGHVEAGFNQMVEKLRDQVGELRASRARIVEAADAERARIERNLHDGAQQRLLSLSFALRAAERAVEGSPEAEEKLRAALVELDHALAELRELARGIHPAILDDEGLGAAIGSLAERAPVPTDVTASLNGRLASAVEVTAYFVVAESVANIAKYAEASRARIEAFVKDGSLQLNITDDGRGGADPTRGSGLRGLADRVAALGGELSVESPPGGGTRVRASIPCE